MKDSQKSQPITEENQLISLVSLCQKCMMTLPFPLEALPTAAHWEFIRMVHREIIKQK